MGCGKADVTKENGAGPHSDKPTSRDLAALPLIPLAIAEIEAYEWLE